MKTFVWTMAYWDSWDHAQQQSLMLNRWLGESERLFVPEHIFVACGTWSDPAFSPLPRWIPIINGGVKKDRPYDCIWWSYAGTAFTAALSYAMIRPFWDVLILHDTDVLVGAVDFDKLLRDFMDRKETFLCSNWHGRPGGGSITAWKPEAAVKWLNQRRRANFIERKPDQPEPMLLEDEFGEIYKDTWHNPWPQFETMRYDYGLPSQLKGDPRQVLNWPFVRMPHVEVVEEYKRTQTAKANPIKR